MAPRQQSTERTEREFAADVSQAVANTEAEIFDDAMGDESLDMDGDTSLEEMGDDLEGDEKDADEAEAQDQDEDDVADARGTDEDDEQETDEDQDDAQSSQQQRGNVEVPLRAERERRRAAEGEAAELRRQLAELNGRMTELSARVNTPQQRQEQKQDPEPDMFAEPEAWKAWNRRQLQQEARELARQELAGFRQELQQRDEARINGSFNEAALGPRSFEFNAAYQALTSLDPRNPRDRLTVQRIVNAADPANALFDWWEDNGGPEYRDSIARQLGFVQDERQQRSQQRPQQSQQPRHVTRVPPSLNSARGGQRRQVVDPDMLDDSDNAVFRFATR